MIDSIYANARAISLENGLLGVDRLNRMIECSKAEDALKILLEVNFGEGASADSPIEFEELTRQEEKKLINFIITVSPSEKLKNFLLIKYDYHNAEALMKAKYLKIDAAVMRTESGLIDINFMKEKIMVDEYKDFTIHLSEALMASDNLFVSGKANGQNISQAFKSALYAELYEISKKDKILSEIYKAKASAVNISLALRTRNFAEAKEMFVKSELSETELKSLCEDNAETLKEKFKFFYLKEMLYSALDSFTSGKPLTEFEKSADGYALTLLKQDKYGSDGIIPFIRYLYYKLAEISNVRIIMSCLNNGIDKKEISSRVRETYEG